MTPAIAPALSRSILPPRSSTQWLSAASSNINRSTIVFSIGSDLRPVRTSGFSLLREQVKLRGQVRSSGFSLLREQVKLRGQVWSSGFSLLREQVKLRGQVWSSGFSLLREQVKLRGQPKG